MMHRCAGTVVDGEMNFPNGPVPGSGNVDVSTQVEAVVRSIQSGNGDGWACDTGCIQGAIEAADAVVNRQGKIVSMEVIGTRLIVVEVVRDVRIEGAEAVAHPEVSVPIQAHVTIAKHVNGAG